MTSARQAIGVWPAATRLALCALTASLVTLSGTSPSAAATSTTAAATAAPQAVTVDYRSNSRTNSYLVTIRATVSRDNNDYTIEGTVTSECLHSRGPEQKWGLAFGSSAESWRYLQGDCSESRPRTEPIKVTGQLGKDGRVYLQAGAYGGLSQGAWGWGTQRSVWV